MITECHKASRLAALVTLQWSTVSIGTSFTIFQVGSRASSSVNHRSIVLGITRQSVAKTITQISVNMAVFGFAKGLSKWLQATCLVARNVQCIGCTSYPCLCFSIVFAAYPILYCHSSTGVVKWTASIAFRASSAIP